MDNGVVLGVDRESSEVAEGAQFSEICVMLPARARRRLLRRGRPLNLREAVPEALRELSASA
jgi:hypothetical protein